MIIDEGAYLAHYGILRKSGRYPWGSGGNVVQRSRDFQSIVEELRAKGVKDTDIAKMFEMSTTELRATNSIAVNQIKRDNIATAEKLKAKGLSNPAIGERMGVNESVIRTWLADGAKEKAEVLDTVSEMLRKEVSEKGIIDIGAGVETHIGITKTKLSTAVALLKAEGYKTYSIPQPQAGTGKNTQVKVLVPPGTTWGDAAKMKENIQQIFSYSPDGGKTMFGIIPPISISDSRVGVRYKEDGGDQADGVIYVRPNVPEVSLGNASYAQVRILVNDSHYLKGMAMYKDDLPDGVDLLFNTNKSDTGNKLDALKKVTGDDKNPFGAQISRQLAIKDADGNDKLTSVMNIVNEEGDWGEWSKTLSTQVLSKQNPKLAKQQLEITYKEALKEYDDIMALTNPVVKKQLLEAFSDQMDSSAVHLKAASLPNQRTHVILPIESIPETQVYAPNYADGTPVVLIRYPHGGTFEIPEVTVNNNHPESKRLLGNARDAIGIHPKVAERLSGADFDGDTVLVIPNNGSKQIKHTKALEALKGFDPKSEYKAYEGMPKMSSRQKQMEMGYVSNLITDMTIKGADFDEIARAVKHSMVVIDAEKHNLDYKRSAIENGISALKRKYQGSARGGASTLISRATSDKRVKERKPRSMAEGGPIDPVTGKKVYVETGKTRTSKAGVVSPALTRTTKLAETDDAFTLSSGTPIEKIYAEHSNRLKDLANQARLSYLNQPNLRYSPSAKAVFAKEVESLNSKLFVARRNAPLERQAQILAGITIREAKRAEPDMDKATLKKVKSQAIIGARIRTGAGKEKIYITDDEWLAIQSGAITGSLLGEMLRNADLDRVRDLATPKVKPALGSGQKLRAMQLLATGNFTRQEVASQLGVSLTTLDKAVKEAEG